MPAFDGPLYISIDMDGFDPSCAPGVSHLEPGGLTARDVIDVLLAIETPIAGADVVELNPDRDVNDMTAVLAAKIGQGARRAGDRVPPCPLTQPPRSNPTAASRSIR